MPDYMRKRSKEEKDKSARLVAKTLKTTTPTHGKPGSWGDKVPGTFSDEALEPEPSLVEEVGEALEEAAMAISEEAIKNAQEALEPEIDRQAEAEPEPSNILSGDIDVGPYEAEIAALKAKLAELTKDEPDNPS